MSEPASELEIVLERVTIERGRTFSVLAVERVARDIAVWIAEETAKRWDTTGVPPTRAVLKIELQ